MPEPDHSERHHPGEADDEEGRADEHATDIAAVTHAPVDPRGRRTVRECLEYCARPAHLRRTVRIALAVGLVLTAVNQLDVIAAGEATAVTWVKCALNFVVPFVVSNLGLLSATAGR